MKLTFLLFALLSFLYSPIAELSDLTDIETRYAEWPQLDSLLIAMTSPNNPNRPLGPFGLDSRDSLFIIELPLSDFVSFIVVFDDFEDTPGKYTENNGFQSFDRGFAWSITQNKWIGVCGSPGHQACTNWCFPQHCSEVEDVTYHTYQSLFDRWNVHFSNIAGYMKDSLIIWAARLGIEPELTVTKL